MTVDVLVIGAGGFGRETLDVIAAVNSAAAGVQFTVLGVVDSSPRQADLQRLKDRGVSYLGTETDWLARGRATPYIIAIGNPGVRAEVAKRWRESPAAPISVVHPTAQIGSLTTLGPGSVICGGAQISTNVTLGSHVHVNPNATVGHDSLLDDFASINPGAIVSGEVHVCARVLVGAGATVLQGRRLGEGCTVGAAACVTKDVTAGQVVTGVPARESPLK